MVVVVVKLSGVFSLRSRDDYGLPKGGLGFFFSPKFLQSAFTCGGIGDSVGGGQNVIDAFRKSLKSHSRTVVRNGTSVVHEGKQIKLCLRRSVFLLVEIISWTKPTNKQT